MPRLTMEALMAPGGLLDAGSRLTQTLVETPFKRAQLRADIREQEIGRAEQKQLRATAMQREDEAIARGEKQMSKAQRIKYYETALSNKERQLEDIGKQLREGKAASMRAKLKAAGVPDKDIEQGVKLATAFLATPGSGLESLKGDPTALANAARKFVDTFQAAGIPADANQIMSIMTSPDADVDEGLRGEYNRLFDQTEEIKKRYEDEVGIAHDTVKAQQLADALAPETPAAPAQKTLGPPGMVDVGHGMDTAPTLPVQPVSATPAKARTGNAMADAMTEVDQDLSGQSTAAPQELDENHRAILMGQMAMHDPNVQAGVDLGNQQNAAANALSDAAFNSKERFFQNAPGVPLPLTKAAQTAPRSYADPHAQAWSKLLTDFGRNAKFTPEQQAQFEAEVTRQGMQPGTLAAMPDITQHMLDEKYGGLSKHASPEERRNIENLAFHRTIGKRLSKAAIHTLSP